MSGTVTIVPNRLSRRERITLTSNQYYGALNRRFDRRATLLRKLGWQYKVVQVIRYDGDKFPPTMGVFIRTGRRDYIPACKVMEYYNYGFIALLASILNH